MDKKILCLIDGLCLGGAERQMIGLASLLKNSGYTVDLAYYHNKCFYTELIKDEGVNSVLINVGKSQISKLYHIYRFIKRGKYDVVISYKHGPNAISCLIKLLGGNFKLLVSERITNQTVKNKDKVKFFLYRWADFVVPNSTMQKVFINNNFPKLSRKTITITNFTDTDYFKPVATPIVHSPRRILTVARISEQKNIRNYLEAIKQVTQVEKEVLFEWYGDALGGDKCFLEECEEIVEKLQIGKCFSFHNATLNILEKYQECDIFCLPSLFEGYPNAICEAMSCGKPVICSNICDNPDIVEDGKSGLLFDPNNIQDMADKILMLISKDDKELKIMGEHGLDFSRSQLSKEAFVNKYIKLIE